MKLLLSALEPSGYALGTSLARQLRGLRPEVEMFGLGDQAMAAEGVELLAIEPVAAMWLFSVLKQVPQYLRLLKAAHKAMDERRPDGVVLIDSSGFHFYLAKAAARRGIPVIYYVSPQIWAYNSERIRKIRRWVDKLLVLYPFEEAYYRERGVEAVYVGHPLFAAERAPEDPRAKEILAGGGRWVGLLPGSRTEEIRKTLPLMRRLAERLSSELADLRFCVSISHERNERLVRSLIDGTSWPTIFRSTGAIIARSELALVKSGTTTLEALIHATPAIVLYRISRLMSFLGRPWIESPYIALPNLFAGEEVLPEFLLHDDRIDEVYSAARSILDDPARAEAMRARLREERRPFLGMADPSEAAAREVLALLDSSFRGAREAGP